MSSLSIFFDDKYEEVMQQIDPKMNSFDKLIFLNGRMNKVIEEELEKFKNDFEVLKKCLNGLVDTILFEDESIIRDYQAIQKSWFIYSVINNVFYHSLSQVRNAMDRLLYKKYFGYNIY
ncbi:hypothetical protein [Clostridium sp. BL-8]|uniref:hypothetical protein n=1 Tax=Clostridium sp. BL-8 TaxID=349938 RepID=UPI0009CD6531|nr:hypothetical protein [Clostridium sp. BL-8]OOM74986.1 hypothetical protein CLOBL_41360 [Clostridium sp. BL-8]